MPNLSIYFIYKKDLFPQIDSPYTLGMASSDIVPIPLPTIRRLPHYLQALRKRLILKEEFTSTTLLAEYLHLKAIQVRKDMNYTGIEGRRKLGYHTASLVTAIEEILGIRNFKEAVLVGVGNLGSALLKYSGLNSGNSPSGPPLTWTPKKSVRPSEPPKSNPSLHCPSTSKTSGSKSPSFPSPPRKPSKSPTTSSAKGLRGSGILPRLTLRCRKMLSSGERTSCKT
jgi:hypothetical protein